MKEKALEKLGNRAKRKSQTTQAKKETVKVMEKLTHKRENAQNLRDRWRRRNSGLPMPSQRKWDLSPNQTDMISMGYDRFAEQMPGDLWKLLPHTFATIMSDGAWIAFKYLVMISHVIATAIGMGGGRIAISVPPRHGKSWFLSQWVPTWFLANWPANRVILTTYEANFAATWGRRVRNIVADVGARVGLYLSDDSTAANNWATSVGGGMVTAGVGGPITGKGFNLGIIDDPHKNWQEAQSETTRKMVQDWFDSTFYTRAEPGATIVVIHTRWHQDDLIGYLKREKPSDGWFHIRIPAIAEEDLDPVGRMAGDALCPERYDIDALERIKSNLSAMMWAALFQQRPSPAEGTVFLREKWKHYKVMPKCNFILQSWDTASKKNYDAAYSVCQTWGVSDLGAVLIDQWRQRVEYPQLRKQLEIQYLKYRPNVILIEDRDSGQALLQAAQQETSLPVIGIYPDMDKVIRAQAVSPWHESGRVWVPWITPETQWVGDLIENAAMFPNALWKDEIDTMSQALAYIMTMAIGGRIQHGVKRRTTQLLSGFRDMM